MSFQKKDSSDARVLAAKGDSKAPNGKKDIYSMPYIVQPTDRCPVQETQPASVLIVPSHPVAQVLSVHYSDGFPTILIPLIIRLRNLPRVASGTSLQRTNVYLA